MTEEHHETPESEPSGSPSDRPGKAMEALDIAGYEARDLPSAIADLLTDLRHLCDREGLAFHELDRRAHRHYAEEKGCA